MKASHEYNKGLSIAFGALIGVIVGFQLGGLVTALAVGASVGIALGAVLEGEGKKAPSRKRKSRKK